MKKHLEMAAIDPTDNKWEKVEGIWNGNDLFYSLLPPSSFISSELPISLTGTKANNPLSPYPPIYQAEHHKRELERVRFSENRSEKESAVLQGKMEKEFGDWLIESGSIYEVTGLMGVETDLLSSAVV
jgi:hypothetical protein